MTDSEVQALRLTLSALRDELVECAAAQHTEPAAVGAHLIKAQKHLTAALQLIGPPAEEISAGVFAGIEGGE